MLGNNPDDIIAILAWGQPDPRAVEALSQENTPQSRLTRPPEVRSIRGQQAIIARAVAAGYLPDAPVADAAKAAAHRAYDRKRRRTRQDGRRVTVRIEEE